MLRPHVVEASRRDESLLLGTDAVARQDSSTAMAHLTGPCPRRTIDLTACSGPERGFPSPSVDRRVHHPAGVGLAPALIPSPRHIACRP